MKLKKRYLLLGSTLTVSAALILSACASSQLNKGVFFTSSSADLLKNNSVPLSMFNVSPTSSFFGNAYAGLTNYVATGTNRDDGVNVTDQIKEKLVLELALSVTGYRKTTHSGLKGRAQKNGSTDSSDGSSKNDYTKFNEWDAIDTIYRDSSKSITEDPNYHKITQEATRYEFTINTSLSWVDNAGREVKQNNQPVKLSSKDFERGFETYILSSNLGFNRNGYFIDLMGLDVEKTVGMDKTNGSSDGNGKGIEITDENYDVENYRSVDDNKFNVYLTSPFPFFLSMMSKEFFFPIPHTHPKVKALKLGKDSPLKYNQNNNRKILDQANTNFDGIYGGGVNAWKDTWSVGPYYVESFNQAQIVFKRNQIYDAIITPNLPKTRQENEKPIPAIVSYFQPGATPEVFYSSYIAGGLSASAVPYSQQQDARSRFNGTGDLRWLKIQKTAQSAQVTYSGKPYVANDSTVQLNANITETEAKFLYNSESEEALTIRAGINGLINWKNLAIIDLPNSGDVNYSTVPFGIFKEKPANGTSSGTNTDGIENDYYYKINNNQRLGLIPEQTGTFQKDKNVLDTATVKLSYYSSTKTNGAQVRTASTSGSSSQTSQVSSKQVSVTKQSFISTLKKVGFTGNNPLHFNIKLGNASLSSNQVDYYNALKQALTELGNDNGENLIIPEIILGDAQGPTRNEWYIGLSSVLGFSYWSPDYDGVGTWLDAATQLNSEGIGEVITYNSGSHIVRTLLLAASQNNVFNQIENKLQNNTTTNGKDWCSCITSADLFKDDPYVIKNFGTNGNNGTSASLAFTKKALSLLKFLVDNKVLKADKVKEAIKDPDKYLSKRSKIDDNKPANVSDIHIGYELKDLYDNAAQLNRFNSIWAEQDTDNAKFLITVVDSYFPVLPVSAPGLNETIPSLLKPWFSLRNAPSGIATMRDSGYIDE